MLKNKMVKKTLMFTFAFLIVMSSVSMVENKAAVVPGITYEPQDTEYSTGFYAEGVEVFPFRNTAAGVHAGFIGGSVTLPFDLTEAKYNNLQAFSLLLSKQQVWRNYELPRRFWDIADGATMMLVFSGDPDLAIDRGREIRDMIEDIYNIKMFLVYGRYESRDGHQVTMLVYQGYVDSIAFNDYVAEFPNYIADDGLGVGITPGVLISAPIKVMSISLFKGPIFREMIPREIVTLFPAVGVTPLFVPLVECAWMDPNGLQKTDTIMEMNLTRLMPGLSVVDGASNSWASFVTMKLPYVVDVLEIDPPTDNMYAHFKGEFEWTLKLDIPIFSFDRSYDDIYVKYDLNLTGLTHFPKIIGEMSLNSSSLLTDGGDIIYDFTFTNVGNEPAYNIELTYGEFNKSELSGINLPMAKPNLTFDPDKTMYYDTASELFTDSVLVGPEIHVVHGWFYNESDSEWVENGQTLSTDNIENLNDILFIEDSYLEIETTDFTPVDIDDDFATMSTTILQLDPGQNETKSLIIKNIPNSTEKIYSHITLGNQTFIFTINNVIDYLNAFGSSLHIPEDQQSWTNLIPEPVLGSAFFYTDADNKEFMGITNGLIIQIYDDEAILVGKMTLDSDYYRFGDDVTFTLELENVGDAPATNIHYTFYHAFLTENFNLPVVQGIPGSEGMISTINPGETKNATYVYPAETAVGLHPVFAIFNYTSSESEDATYLDIFSSVGHPAVVSSLDFAMVLPPVHKDGTTEPIYPTPEVETTTDVFGFVEGETTVGDTITLQTNITNDGDEDTNIIYTQFIPRRLAYVDNTLEITIDGVPVENFEIERVSYQPDIRLDNYNPFMPIVRIYGEKVEGTYYGIPLDVDETLIIKANFTIIRGRRIAEVDWNDIPGGDLVGLYIPPADVRYFSHYDMRETAGLNGNTNIPGDVDATEARTASLTNDYLILSFNSNADPRIGEEWASTNSWGSYSDSLSLVLQEFLGLGPNAIYYGLGIIAVTGVAILIYFTANGKRRK